MELLWLDPNYAALLYESGLRQFEDFMNAHRARVIRRRQNGTRSVALLRIGPLTTYLKREHRIAYKERFRNWWDGYGAVGKSLREWRLLRKALQAGFCVPRPLACGQQGRRAFLLTLELEDFVPLDKYLAGASAKELKLLSSRLPRWLARWHAAGFMHPDLYAWHVFIRVTDQEIAVLDLARADQVEEVPWPERWRELALLGVSLREQEELVASWEQILDSYLNAVSALEARLVLEPRSLVKGAVYRRMQRWTKWVARRQQEEEECRVVLDRELYARKPR
ncbi:MAG: lipopolysaccharide kinase InaA family protein [Gemmatales bacterium]|nr:lipopolysaccharide kinase InaA family protein [Gemmatales bacterium]MDW7993732.1 lipopolysaccharide kinase InaA family protein [Gemmatales bacterium]